MPVKSRVQISGVRELRRDLKRVDKTLPKQLNVRLKQVAQPVARDAALLAPRRSGKLAGSLRVATRGSKVSIVSRLPYASIVHWGGRHPVFGNREEWVRVPARPFIVTAAARHADRIERQVADEVEDLMRDIGFT